jgi:gamma-glutamyltranspeptidase/glutathione hydrolase
MYLKTLIILVSLVSCSTNYKLAKLGKNQTRKEHEAVGSKYMITTPGKHASLAGKKMFEKGGNIVDAATAITFVLSVERPQSTGIGGGGFLLQKSADKIKAWDFREKAPLRSHSKIFLDKKGNEIKNKSRDGIFAAGVPGLVAGILEIHQKEGALPLKDVIAPAIDLAENGFTVYPELAFALEVREKVLFSYPSTRKIFFKSGNVLKEGDRLIQKDLANTLRSIAVFGRDGFYRGQVARQIINENKKWNGLISQKDLDLYNVKQRAPIVGEYKGYKIISMPPPSSGGIHIIQILNILEKFDLKSWGIQNPKTIHYTASAMQQAFADRAKHLGDADFVHVPVHGLTSKGYAEEVRSKLTGKARSKEDVYPGKFSKKEADHTTHFTIMDDKGNVISSTQTVNGFFGSGLVVSGAGFFLNNEMDDFSTKPGAINLFGAVGGSKNLVEPEKRPLSSMSPSIVMKDGEVVMALGTPNGTRILTCVAQTILNYIEHKLPLYDSVMALRYHHQWHPDKIWIEEGFPENTLANLKARGHQFKEGGIWCKVQAIARENSKLIGVSDARGRGIAVGE